MNIKEKEAQHIFSATATAKKPAAAPQEPDAIDLDLEKLITLGVIEREVKIDKFVFVMRSLSEETRDSVNKALSPDIKVDDLDSRLAAIKRPSLVASIQSINGMVFDTPDTKSKLANVLGKMQGMIVDKLFMEYMKLTTDQSVLLDDGLKKNSQ